MRILKRALSFTAYGTVILCLSACSSKDGVTSLQQDKTNWYCTPSPSSGEQSSRLNNDEWRCQESAEAYNDLASKPQPEALVSEEQTTVTEVRKEPSVVADIKDYGTVTREQTSSAKNETAGNKTIKSETVKNETDKSITQETVSSEPSTAPSSELTMTSSAKDDSPAISNWVVQLAAYTDEDSAQALVEKLVTSEYVRTQVDGQEFFTVVVLGFEHRYEAESTASLIKNRHSTLTPWIRSGASFRQILAQ